MQHASRKLKSRPTPPAAPTHHRPGSPARPGSAAVLALLILGVAAIVTAVHWPVLSARALAADDDMYLLDNHRVQNPSWSAAARFLAEVLEPTTVEGYYQPLAMISLMTDCALGASPDNLRPIHRTSLALHVVNTALVIVLLYLLFGSPWVATAVGLLFGLHPMTVEPVAWLSERKTLLAACFALLMLLCYVRYTRRPSVPSYIGTLLLYALALLSKPTTTPLPVLLLLLDYWPLRRLSRRSVVEKIPLFVLGVISAVITYVSQTRTAVTILPGAQSVWRGPLILCHNAIYYLYKIIWPLDLTPHTPFPEPFTPANPHVLASLLLAPLLAAVVLLSWRRTRAVLVGWLFFMVAVFPTLGLIGFAAVIASDKYVYLPAVGLLLTLAWALRRALDHTGRPIAARRRTILVVLCVLAAGCGVLTRRQLGFWQTSLDLSRHMVALTPQAPDARLQYGVVLMNLNQLDAARAQFDAVLQKAPHDSTAHYNLGVLNASHSRLQDALEHYQIALQWAGKQHTRPDRATVLNNLASTLMELGRYDEAEPRLQEALQLKPRLIAACNNLGAIQTLRKNPQLAITYYERALTIDPRNVVAHTGYAAALLDFGQTDTALAHLAAAQQLKPDSAEAQNQLGRARQAQGRIDDALRAYTRALELDPRLILAHLNAASLLVDQGRLEEAAAHYTAVVHLRPQHVAAHINLGTLKLRLGRPQEAVEPLRAAVQLDPDSVLARQHLGQALAMVDEPDAAIEQYRQALAREPNSPGVHTDLGNTLGAVGHLEAAVDEYRAALRSDPDYAAAYFGLGLALEELGQTNDALRAFQEVLRIKPNDPLARERLEALQAERE